MPFHWVCLKLHMLRRHCVPHWQCHPTNCSYASTAAAFASARFYRVLIFRGCDDIHVCVRPCEVIDDGCAGCNLNKCKCGVWHPSREWHIHRVFFYLVVFQLSCWVPFYFICRITMTMLFLDLYFSLGDGTLRMAHTSCCNSSSCECLLYWQALVYLIMS